MSQKLLTKRNGLLVLAIATFSVITLNAPHLQPSHTSALSGTSWKVSSTYQVSLHNEAQATSGGRAGGGSFGSSGGSSSGGSSSGGSASGSSSSGSSSSGSSASSDYSSSSSYPASSGSSSGSDGGTAIFIGIIMALACVGLVFLTVHKIVLNIFNFFTNVLLAITNPAEYKAQKAKQKAQSEAGQALLQQRREISNDVVTVTQVQVALHGEAREVQRDLNQLTHKIDWSTAEGLSTSLKETALTLLRAADSWSHASACSKTVSTREAAKQQFDILSMEERSKFDVESLVNMRGNLTRKSINHSEQESADYIVVTLIVGTAHDAPLVETIHTVDELKSMLKLLGTLPPNYLMVYEMLWSPQDESDSLTYEELLLNYPNMYQIS